MSTPEHLDAETTAPDLPDGYDLDGGWEPTEWLDALRPADFDDVQRYEIQWWEQRPADFDDEERRP